MSDTIILDNRYQLEEQLGSGGMAVVYRARDLMLERNVALKILRKNLSADPAFRERFHQEAKAAANLSHPNLVIVHDFGLDTGRLFIVMEYIPGDHIKNLLKQQGRFNLEDTLNLMVQACAGIGYAHRAGLVHCDIKPHNMIVTPDKRLKVADFGIARAFASIQPQEKTEVVWGSPQYFSPEQASGSAPSPASDVYSIGVVMYEMLTGQLPFLGDSATELARQHRDELPTSPRIYNPDIPPELEQILFKVLSKEPSARYRTAGQLGRVLVTFRQGVFPSPDSLNAAGFLLLEADQKNFPASAETMPPAPRQDQLPPQAVMPATTPPVVHQPSTSPQPDPLTIDWLTIALALLALIAVGGLFPFFIWVYYLYR